MKYFKYTLLFIIISILFFNVNYIYAFAGSNTELTPSKKNLFADSMCYDAYDIKVKVNEDNTYEVVEKINVNFTTSKHGISRDFNLVQPVIYKSGTVKRYANISDIDVNAEFDEIRKNNQLKIKIGDPDKTVIGKQSYTISYTYSVLDNDPSKEWDEFYYNIVGSKFKTYVGNITFSITMPKKFDQSKIGFSSGSYSSTNYEGVTYTVNGNTITGKYNNILSPYEALTMRLELPEGYFLKKGTGIHPFCIIAIILCILTSFICFILWNKYGKDDIPIETVEFYPPKGYNSAEIGLLYKGHAGSEEVTSLIIHMANKGYINIVENKKNFIFKKIKEYDGTDPIERKFMNGFFSCGKGKEVKISDLKNKFYTTQNDIISDLNTGSLHDSIYEDNSKPHIISFIFIVLSFFMLIFAPTFSVLRTSVILPILIMTGIIACVLIFEKIAIHNEKINCAINIITVIGIYVFLLIGKSIPFSMILKINPFNIVTTLTALPFMLIAVSLYAFMTKRTAFGTSMLGTLKGFKRYLTTAEKLRLEQLVADNPSYFYDILPFTYVLGVSGVWMKNFEGIGMEPPTWYYGYSDFNMIHFNRALTSTLSSASTAMASSPQSSSSTGGGFSGGGFGGGGSGSW